MDWDAAYTDKPDAGQDAGWPLHTPDIEAPAGWHRWPYPPDDCALFVPDDLGTVAPPPWEPCPFMPVGCRRATAPWAAEAGWGYGGQLRVAVVGGRTYLATVRAVDPDGWYEVLLLHDNVVIGAWRENLPRSECGLSPPWIERDGKASAIVNRHQIEHSPVAYLSTPETLMAAPERAEVFGAPDAYSLASGPAQRSGKLLTLREHYGRFTVRDLATGATARPAPAQGFAELLGEVPVGGSVFYHAWTGYLASIWVWNPANSYPLLKDTVYSYDGFVTDGVHAAWTRSHDQTDLNTFETVELWTSPLADTGPMLQPKKLATLPVNGIVPLSIGEGWVAVFGVPEMIRLYRISDGLVRRVPAVDGLHWNAWGQYDGLVIAGGALWVKTATDIAPGNDIRFITRFEIDKLPEP